MIKSILALLRSLNPRLNLSLSLPLSLSLSLPLSLFLPPQVQAQIQKDTTPVSIGVIISKTGPASEISENWFKGVELAVQNLNKEQLKVLIRVEEDRSSPSEAAAQFEKLIKEYKVDIVIAGSLDYLVERLSSSAARYKKTLITPVVPLEVLSESAKNNPWLYSTSYSIEDSRDAVMKFLKSYLTRNAVVIHGDSASNRVWGGNFEKLAKENKTKIIFKREIGFKSYRDKLISTALDITAKRPDVVFLALEYSGIHIMVRELERLQYDPLIFTVPDLEKAFAFSNLKGPYRNAFTAFPTYNRSKFYADFYLRFEDKPPLYAPSGYDALVIAATALEQGVKVGEVSSAETVSERKLKLYSTASGIFEAKVDKKKVEEKKEQ